MTLSHENDFFAVGGGVPLIQGQWSGVLRFPLLLAYYSFEQTVIARYFRLRLIRIRDTIILRLIRIRDTIILIVLEILLF